MGVNKEESTPNRIPIHFADEEFAGVDASSSNKQDSSGNAESGGGNTDSELTPEEIGSQSSYEGETEVQRRIDRGEEQTDAAGRDRADDRDRAGSPPSNEVPHNREDADTTERHAAAESPSEGKADATAPTVPSPLSAGPMLAELIAARAELKRLETERTDLHDKLSRRQADFENYRKRTERERGENYNKIVGDVIGNLLPVLDNLRRALDAEAFAQASESEEFRHFLHGVELISKQLNGVLEDLGLRPVEALGQPFDPHLHEAVATESSNEYEPDTIMQELTRGYVLGDKLLRPAMVKVATK